MAKTDASTLSTQDIIVVNPVSLSSLLEEQQAKLYSFDSGVTDSPPTSELIAVESTYDFSFVERRLGSVANGTTETEQSDAEKVTWDTQHSETEPVSQPIVINADLVTQPITAVVDVQQPDVAVTQDFYYWDSNFWNSPIGSTERIYAIKRMVDQAKTFSEFETVLYKQEVQGNFIDRSFIINKMKSLAESTADWYVVYCTSYGEYASAPNETQIFALNKMVETASNSNDFNDWQKIYWASPFESKEESNAVNHMAGLAKSFDQITATFWILPIGDARKNSMLKSMDAQATSFHDWLNVCQASPGFASDDDQAKAYANMADQAKTLEDWKQVSDVAVYQNNNQYADLALKHMSDPATVTQTLAPIIDQAITPLNNGGKLIQLDIVVTGTLNEDRQEADYSISTVTGFNIGVSYTPQTDETMSMSVAKMLTKPLLDIYGNPQTINKHLSDLTYDVRGSVETIPPENVYYEPQVWSDIASAINPDSGDVSMEIARMLTKGAIAPLLAQHKDGWDKFVREMDLDFGFHDNSDPAKPVDIDLEIIYNKPQGEDAVTMAEELAKLLYQSAIQPLHDRYGADMISQLDKVDVKWGSYGESYSSEAEKAYWSPTVNQVDIGLGTVIPVDLGLNNPAKNQAELAGMSLKG